MFRSSVLLVRTIVQCPTRALTNSAAPDAKPADATKDKKTVLVQRNPFTNGPTSVHQYTNGVKSVVFEKDDQFSAAGVYVNTGSANETYETHGSAHYLSRFLYKSTTRLSGLRMTRSLELLANDITVEPRREALVYKFTASPQRQRLLHSLELIADALRPRVPEWEFREVRELVKSDIAQRKANIDLRVEDLIYSTAYRGVGLGRSPLCPEYNVDNIYPEQLRDYIVNNVTGANIKVAGNIRDTGLFVRYVVQSFAPFARDGPAGPRAKEASQYYGGVHLSPDAAPNVYVEAFNGVAPSISKEYLAQRLLRILLGAASGSFALPGSGVSSRLGKAFRGSDIEKAYTFSNQHSSSSLFGVVSYGGASLKELGETIHAQLGALASSPISQQELEKAVAQFITKYRLRDDSRLSALDKYAQVSPSFYPDNILSLVKTVTPQDIQAVAQTIISSTPTVIALGNLSSLPTFKPF